MIVRDQNTKLVTGAVENGKTKRPIENQYSSKVETQLEYGKKNPKKMADIIKAATMLSKIVKRLK